MRNQVCDMTINRESLEMYAFITQILGENANSYSHEEMEFTWTLIDGICISIQMVSGEDYPNIIIHDAFDLFEKYIK